MIGSTMLGITLIRRGYRPRVTGWLLALSLPLSIVIGMFTSMGSGALPEMFAFGIAGHLLARSSDTAEAPTPPRSRRDRLTRAEPAGGSQARRFPGQPVTHVLRERCNARQVQVSPVNR